jgi:lysophospholipase L1-like esterase
LPALTAAQILALNSGGQFSIEVESGYFDPAYAGSGNEYFFYASENGTTTFYIGKGNATGNLGGGAGTGSPNVATVSNEGAQGDGGTHNLIHVSWDNLGYTVYRDYLPVLKKAWTSKPTGLFTTINIGGTGAGGTASIKTFRVRNFSISSRKIMLPVRQQLRDVIVLGHSFTVNGDYQNANSVMLGGSAYASYQDSGWIPQLNRLINKSGYTFGLRRLTSYGVSGSLIAACTTQLTTAIAAGHRKPDVGILMTGVNDVLGAGNNPLTSQFLTDFHTAIDAMIAINPSMEILVANMADPTGYTGATWTLANFNQGNAYIDTLEASYPNNVTKVDMFNSLGGFNKNSADFVADLLHTSKAGFMKIANTVYAKLITVI